MCRPEEATDTPLDYYMICMVCEEQTPAERESCVVCKGKGKIDWAQLIEEFDLQEYLADRVIALQAENSRLRRKLKESKPQMKSPHRRRQLPIAA